MEKGDLEFGEIDLIQDTLQSLLDRAENEGNHTDQFSPLVYVAPEEITFSMEISDLELQNIDKTKNHTQRFLYRVTEYEENHMDQLLPSIYMARDTLRDLSPSSFNPRLVSIGPLHREDKNVQAFEKQKISYMIRLMRRIESPQEEVIKSCMEKVYTSMIKIKACYVWTKSYDDVEIAEMMVMDACFILEFISSYKGSDSYARNRLIPDSVIFDFLLLENQIPFFFLEEIYQCTILKNHPHKSLIQFLYPIINNMSLFRRNIELPNISLETTPHILSILHECYKPPSHITSISFPSIINSVIDLDRAGVNFKPNQNPTWAMEMEVKLPKFLFFLDFWSKPTLRIPVMYIHDFTELVFRNLIAYEQMSEACTYITSYAIAMDMLVDTQEDVAKLIDSKILVNVMGSNEETATMINSICKEVSCPDFFYGEEWAKLNKYCNMYWPKNISWLRSTYFNNPWNIIALFAGIVLFALTVVQTIFTIKSK